MKRQISLRWLVTLAFLSLGALLVIGYSLLSASYFVRGMDSIMASNMERAALSYLSVVPAAGSERPNSIDGYRIARYWEQVPADVRAAFGQAPSETGILLKHDDSGWLTRPDVIYFLIRYRHLGETLYVSFKGSADKASKLVGQQISRSMRTLLAVSVLIALTLTATIWLLVRRVSQPVAALGRWTRTLDAERLNVPPPNFAYPELNALAELIRSSLASVQEALEREHRFLRHASHELRTPISVIRSNIELMHKLQEAAGRPLEPREAQAIERIDRASLSMQHLTETLLWLSRDAIETPSKRPVRLDRLVRQLVDETAYLLNDKQVAVELQTQPHLVNLPEIPARIVLGNLIRNAFQHTWEGQVVVRQRQGRVEIVNQQQDGDDSGQSLGFGLGLQLTAQLIARLGWGYVNEAGPLGHRVSLTLSRSAYPDQEGD